MKFINPSVEFWPQEAGIRGMWKQIARATRVCYQSQAREGESDEDFVKRVILKPAIKDYSENEFGGVVAKSFDFNKMHGAMLEHGTVYLYLPLNYNRADFFEITESPYNKTAYDAANNALVTSNMRYIIENNKLDILKEYGCAAPSSLHPKRYTFSVITDIGVTREGNRMRANSTAEESTRYNAYDKGKYGSELTYVVPDWKNADNLNGYAEDYSLRDMVNNVATGHTKDWTSQDYYMFGLWASEFAYMGMRKCGERAEHCRQVLPLNTKTQVVWTAFADDWKHFLKLRSSQAVSGKPHENMIIIADKIAQIAKEQNLW